MSDKREKPPNLRKSDKNPDVDDVDAVACAHLLISMEGSEACKVAARLATRAAADGDLKQSRAWAKVVRQLELIEGRLAVAPLR